MSKCAKPVADVGLSQVRSRLSALGRVSPGGLSRLLCLALGCLALGAAPLAAQEEPVPLTFAVKPVESAPQQVIPESLTLEQGIAQALRTSPRIAAYAYRTLGANLEVGIASTQMMPTATVSAGRSYVRNDSFSGLVDPDYVDQHTDTLSIQISQPLFAGMSLLNSYQRAQLNEELVMAEQQGETARVLLDVQTTFYDLMKTRGEVDSLRSAEKRLQSSVESARAFEKVRMAPYVDVLQAEVDLADTQQRLIKTANEVATLAVNLNMILGLPTEAAVEYVGRLDETPVGQPPTLQECLARARSQRPDLLVRRKALAMAEKEAEITFGRFFPRIDLQGGYISRDVTYDSTVGVGAVDRDYRTDYWTAGINLQWRIFESGRTRLEHQRLLHQVASLREEVRDVESKVATQVHTALLAVDEARQRIVLAEKTVREAAEGEARSKVRFEARVGTMVELLDAQARLTRAETNHLQAQADLRQAMAQLTFAIGDRVPAAAL